MRNEQATISVSPSLTPHQTAVPWLARVCDILAALLLLLLPAGWVITLVGCVLFWSAAAGLSFGMFVLSWLLLAAIKALAGAARRLATPNVIRVVVNGEEAIQWPR